MNGFIEASIMHNDYRVTRQANGEKVIRLGGSHRLYWNAADWKVTGSGNNVIHMSDDGYESIHAGHDVSSECMTKILTLLH